MSLSRITRILIANRGEIACRIARTANRLGIETVAVYNAADKGALHAKLATESHYIESDFSYGHTWSHQLIKLALSRNVQAIHPGYGFLAEDANFAGLCKLNNLIYIGPPETVLKSVAVKSTCKTIIESAGISIIKGYHGDNQEQSVLLDEAKKLEFPVIIKAVKGCGGRGIRVSYSEIDFFENLYIVQRESLKYFNNNTILLEKYITNSRHIDVQIFGDLHGNIVHLCERDHCIQLHQRTIIEETPGQSITQDIRKKLGKAAIKVASTVGYIGAGTVQFMMDRNFDFYFMGINSQLSIVHPITEMITGFDLIEWQLRIAAGEKLPVMHQQLIMPVGHAFQTQINCEDCSNADKFLNTYGTILGMKMPLNNENVRIDYGVVEGDEVIGHNDPLIANLIVWSHNRSSAIQQLQLALNSFKVVGVTTNLGFLQAIVNHRCFVSGETDSNFIDKHRSDLFAKPRLSSLDFCKAAVSLVIMNNKSGKKTNNMVNVITQTLKLKSDSSMSFDVFIENHVGTELFNVRSEIDAQQSWIISGSSTADGPWTTMKLNIDNNVVNFNVFRNGLDLHVFDSGRHYVYTRETSTSDDVDNSSSNVYRYDMSPMPGTVLDVLVRKGQRVQRGDPIMTLIALKMECCIKANCNGFIKEVNVSRGQTVTYKSQLIELVPDECK